MIGRRILGLATRPLGAGHRKARYAVLNYHRFKSGPPDASARLRSSAFVDVADFERQIEFLRRHTAVIRLSEMVDRIIAGIAPDRFYVALTMDDGYRDNLELALPVLRRQRMPFTIFVTTGFVDDRYRWPWWDVVADFAAAHHGAHDLTLGNRTVRVDLSSESSKRRFVVEASAYMKGHSAYGDVKLAAALLAPGAGDGRTNGFMDWDQLQELASDDLVDVGAHSIGHPVLSSCADGGYEESRESKAKLEARLNRRVEFCAYPFGDPGSVSSSVVEATRAVGFKAAFTLIAGYLTPATDRFLLPRIGITGTDPFDFFQTRLHHADLVRRAHHGLDRMRQLLTSGTPSSLGAKIT